MKAFGISQWWFIRYRSQ